MVTKDEALKLAQRALSNKNASTKSIYEALAAIKEALAHPAQEPVGEVNRYGRDSHGRQWHGIHWYDANVDVPHGTKLYTTPQQQEPRNFCSRCGKRTADLTVIHTCTPPRGLEMT